MNDAHRELDINTSDLPFNSIGVIFDLYPSSETVFLAFLVC